MVVAAVLATAWAGCAHKEEKSADKKAAETPQPVVVTVAPIEKRSIERTIEAVGSLRGWEQVTVGSKRSGRVLKVFHDMGDRVKPDEPLVQLDPVDAQLAYNAAESRYLAELVRLGITSQMADDFVRRYGISETLVNGPQTEEVIEKVAAVVQYRLSMEKAAADLARQRNLNRKGASTTQELEDRETDYRTSIAAYDNAKSTARNIIAMALASRVSRDQQDQLVKDMRILAPQPQQTIPTKAKADDVVYAIASRSVSEGQMIREGDALFDMVIENPLRLWLTVPERYSDRVREGQPVRISVASHPGRTFEGKVARINPTIDSASRTFHVEAVAPNEERLLHPGGFAKAVIVTEAAAEAAVVPIESVVQYAGVTKLFLVEGDKVRAVDDLVLGKEGTGWVEVTSQRLPATGQVVVTGQTKLADGSRIFVRPPESPAEAKPAEADQPRAPTQPEPAKS